MAAVTTAEATPRRSGEEAIMAKNRLDIMFQAQREIAQEHPALHSELCQYAIQLGFEYADTHPEYRK